MIAQFNLLTYPRFIIEGDNEEDFLWDLFDQLMYGDNIHLDNLTIVTDKCNLESNEDRIAHRWSPQWLEDQNNYFISKMTGGIALSGISIPPESVFLIHSASLLSIVMDKTFDHKSFTTKLNYINRKYIYECSEKLELLNKISKSDYFYPTIDSISLINYLVYKNVIVINRYSDRLPGIISDKEIEDQKRKEIDELEYYKNL